MGTIWQDLRYAARMLYKQPGFTLVAVLTLALGIGANSAIFSIVNAVLLKPLPFKDSEQLVRIWESKSETSVGRDFQGTASFLNLKDWREQNHVFEGIAAYQNTNLSLKEESAPERVSALSVSTNFFDLLRVRPQRGRLFLDGEEEPGRNRVVILSDSLWRNNFGADPSLIDKTIMLGGENYRVVGVMPPEFQFPTRNIQLWLPLVLTEQQLTNRDDHLLFVFGRLKPDVTLDQARAEMSQIARRIEEQYPKIQSGRGVKLLSLQEDMVQYARPALLLLLAAVGFVLLIACTNVANLLMARAASRRREIAIRTALGAGRARLIQQFLTESLLLSILGGALGALLANWSMDALRAWAARVLPRAHEIGLDWRVVGFTLLLSFLTGIVFGLAPALHSTKTDLQEALRDGGNSGTSPQRNWVRSLLVVMEVASALVLLVGAGLLIKSFARLQQTDAGFNPDNVLTMGISLPTAKYSTPEARAQFYAAVLEKVQALPGVETAGVINIVPIQISGFNGKVWVEGKAYREGREPIAEYRTISPDYFRSLQIPLTSGRYFGFEDQRQSAPVAIINHALAERYMPGENPVGRRIRTEDTDWVTIVGEVKDVKQGGLARSVMPEIFLPYTQAPAANPTLTQSMSLIVRGQSDPLALARAIRKAVQAVDPAQPVHNVKTMHEIIAESVSDRRLTVWLLGIFAALAVLLSMIGIYSVMSYIVTQNTREIGIRMALGARRRDVLKLVVGQGLILALVGIGLGLVGSFWLTSLIKSLLFGVAATDPYVFAGVSLLLVLIAMLASYLPARRATRVDPMVALRYE